MTITCYFFSANLVNVHEKTRSRPSTWMVVAFLPVSGAESMWDHQGGNSSSVRNTKLMMECNDCLFEGWNEQTAQTHFERWPDKSEVDTPIIIMDPYLGQAGRGQNVGRPWGLSPLPLSSITLSETIKQFCS